MVGGAATPTRSRRRSACAATVPGKQIQAGRFPSLFSRSASSPGFPRCAGGGRGAGGSAPPANPTQTNPVTFGAEPRGSGSACGRAVADPRHPAGRGVGPRRRLRARRSTASVPAEERWMTGKVRRARREAARHAPCDWHSMSSAVAQTFRARRGYSAEGSPAAAHCPSRLGRIRARRPVSARPARPAWPLRTLPPSPCLGPVSFRSAASTEKALQPAAKFSHDLGYDIHEMVARRAGGSSAARPPSRPANSAGESGGVATGAAAVVRAGGASPTRPRIGGGGADGCLGDEGHREPSDAPAAAPAAAAPAAAAAARVPRAGYINTRFHTPELTSAGPAQPRAGPA